MWMVLVLAAATAGEPYVASCGRSPIPQPGENIRWPLSFARLAPPEDAPPADGPVRWTQAHRYVGQTITVEGRIVNTHALANITFLNYSKDWRGKFYVVVFSSAHEASFRPEDEYLNKTLRITGKVVLHRNRPQIQVHNLNQIEIVP